MPYRIELSKTNQAGCQDPICKDNGVKILKGELRLGVWVVIMEHGSFRFKHWGCVSGAQLQNLRMDMQGGDEVPENGEYNWDYFDGLLELPQDFQNKVKTAIIEGKIADEDFKGDPAYNHLGQKAIRARLKKVKPVEEKEDDDGDNQAEGSATPKMSPAKKRDRAKKKEGGDDEQEDFKPAKKRVKKAKKDEDAADDAQENVDPAKRRGKIATKDEISDDEPLTSITKKVKGKRVVKKEEPKDADDVKREVDEQDNADIKLTKRSRNKKVVLKVEDGEAVREDEGALEDVKPPRKALVKKGVKKDGNSQESTINMNDIAPAGGNQINGPNHEENLEDNVDIKPPKNSQAKKVAQKKDPGQAFIQTSNGGVKAEATAHEDRINAKSNAKLTNHSTYKELSANSAQTGDIKMEDIQPFVMGDSKTEGENSANEEEATPAAAPKNTIRRGKKASSGVATVTAAKSRSRRTKSS